MQVFSCKEKTISFPSSVVTIGNFDGIHLGHRALIRLAVNEAKTRGCVSALVTFEQFGRSIIMKMLGKKLSTNIINAVLDEPIYNSERKRIFARVIVEHKGGVYRAKLSGDQSSNLLTSVVRANGLAICPEETEKKEIGDIIEVQMLY